MARVAVLTLAAANVDMVVINYWFALPLFVFILCFLLILSQTLSFG